MIAATATLLGIEGNAPRIDDDAFVADGARLIGDVRMGPGSSVWFNSVIRADNAPVVLGENSNLQDNVVVHVDEDFPATIGANVTVGHQAMLHGCTIGDGCIIGIGAIVLNGAVVGEGCLVAAGTVILEGAVVPPGSLVAGVPGKVRRALDDEEREGLLRNARHYAASARGRYREAERIQ